MAARQVAAKFGKEAGLFVTVQDTGGSFGLHSTDRAWLGGLSGLVKTAAIEWPLAAVRAIDIERGCREADAVAEAMFDGLFFGTTFQSEAARRRRPRGALREQEDEADAHGHGQRRRKELPPGGAPGGLFGCSAGACEIV